MFILWPQFLPAATQIYRRPDVAFDLCCSHSPSEFSQHRQFQEPAARVPSNKRHRNSLIISLYDVLAMLY